MMKGKSVFVKIEERIALKLKKQERFKSDAEKAQEAGMYLCQCDALCFPEEWCMYQWCCKKCAKEVPTTPTPKAPRERMASMYPFRDERSLPIDAKFIEGDDITMTKGMLWCMPCKKWDCKCIQPQFTPPKFIIEKIDKSVWCMSCEKWECKCLQFNKD